MDLDTIQPPRRRLVAGVLFATVGVVVTLALLLPDDEGRAPRDMNRGAEVVANPANAAEPPKDAALVGPAAQDLGTAREARSPQRVAAAAAPVGHLFPGLAVLEFVALAGGRPVGLAALDLKGLGDVHAAPDAARDDLGQLVTDLHGRVIVAVRPLSTFRGTLAKEAQQDDQPRLAGDFVTTSAQAGVSRVVQVELVPRESPGWVHLEIRSLPGRTLVQNASLTLVRPDGGAIFDAAVPTVHVGDASARVAFIWPDEYELRVEAPNSAARQYQKPKGRRRALVPVFASVAEARAAAPLPLEITRDGAARGTFGHAERITGKVRHIWFARRGDQVQEQGADDDSSDDEYPTVTLDSDGRWRIEGLPTKLPSDLERVLRGAEGSPVQLAFELDLDGAKIHFSRELTLGPGEERYLDDPLTHLSQHDVEVWLDGQRAPAGTKVEFHYLGPMSLVDEDRWFFEPEPDPGEALDPDGSHLVMDLNVDAQQAELIAEGEEHFPYFGAQRTVDGFGRIRFLGPANGAYAITARVPRNAAGPARPRVRSQEARGTWRTTSAGPIELSSVR